MNFYKLLLALLLCLAVEGTFAQNICDDQDKCAYAPKDFELNQKYQRNLQQLDNKGLVANEKGLVEAFRRTESRAMILAIGKYSRYLSMEFYRFYDKKKRLIDFPDLNQPGIGAGARQLAHDMESDLKRTYESYDHYGFKTAYTLFKERQQRFFRDLANRSFALVKLDEALQGSKLSASQREQLEAEKAIHLTAQPILASAMRLNDKRFEARSLYSFVYEIYYVIPLNELLCLKRGVTQISCKTLDFVGGQGGIDLLVKNIQFTYSQVQSASDKLTDKALHELNKRSRLSFKHLKQQMNEFPGGRQRLEHLLNVFGSMTDEQILELELRDKICEHFVSQAIRSTIRSIKHALGNLRARTYSDYLIMPQYREAVVSSFEGEDDCVPNFMREVDRRLMVRENRVQKVKAAGDVLFYVAVAVTCFIAPPAGACAIALVAARGIAVAGHAYLEYRKADHLKQLAEIRSAVGINSFADYALAVGQVQTAMTIGILETALAGYAIKANPALNKAILSFFTKSKSLLTVVRSSSKGTSLLLAKNAKGQVLVKRMGLAEMKVIRSVLALGMGAAKAVPGAIGNILKSSLPVTLAHMLGGAITMTVLEIQRHQVSAKEFYKVFGKDLVVQNILVTAFADFGLSFFGLGSYSALKKDITVGGTVFASSILAQTMNHVEDQERLATRGAIESTFAVTYAVWSTSLYNQARVRALQYIPGKRIVLRSGVSVLVFTAGSFINNYIYLETIYGLFQDPKYRHRQNLWWR